MTDTLMIKKTDLDMVEDRLRRASGILDLLFDYLGTRPELGPALIEGVMTASETVDGATEILGKIERPRDERSQELTELCKRTIGIFKPPQEAPVNGA